jgi:hypothetical protein
MGQKILSTYNWIYLVTDEEFYQSTDFARVLKNRVQLCGKVLGEPFFLPYCEDGQVKVGPVAKDILELACEVLYYILQSSVPARRYLYVYAFQHPVSK